MAGTRYPQQWDSLNNNNNGGAAAGFVEELSSSSNNLGDVDIAFAEQSIQQNGKIVFVPSASNSASPGSPQLAIPPSVPPPMYPGVPVFAPMPAPMVSPPVLPTPAPAPAVSTPSPTSPGSRQVGSSGGAAGGSTSSSATTPSTTASMTTTLSGQWACSACTLLNPLAAKTCSLCGSPKPLPNPHDLIVEWIETWLQSEGIMYLRLEAGFRLEFSAVVLTIVVAPSTARVVIRSMLLTSLWPAVRESRALGALSRYIAKENYLTIPVGKLNLDERSGLVTFVTGYDAQPYLHDMAAFFSLLDAQVTIARQGLETRVEELAAAVRAGPQVPPTGTVLAVSEFLKRSDIRVREPECIESRSGTTAHELPMTPFGGAWGQFLMKAVVVEDNARKWATIKFVSWIPISDPSPSVVSGLTKLITMANYNMIVGGFRLYQLTGPSARVAFESFLHFAGDTIPHIQAHIHGLFRRTVNTMQEYYPTLQQVMLMPDQAAELYQEHVAANRGAGSTSQARNSGAPGVAEFNGVIATLRESGMPQEEIFDMLRRAAAASGTDISDAALRGLLVEAGFSGNVGNNRNNQHSGSSVGSGGSGGGGAAGGGGSTPLAMHVTPPVVMASGAASPAVLAPTPTPAPVSAAGAAMPASPTPAPAPAPASAPTPAVAPASSPAPADAASTAGKAPETDAGMIPLSSLELGSLIGAGGMGNVYRGTYYGCPVAIKTMKTSAAQEEQRKAFEREIKLHSALRFPRIAQVYGVCVNGSEMMLVMQLCDCDLRTYLGRHTSAPIAERFRIAIELCEGMCFLHAKNITHYDLKPDNIMMDYAGHVLVSDFGLSKYTSAVTSNTSSMANGFTLCYAAPEVLKGEHYDQPKMTDVYSAAIVLYELFTGNSAYENVNVPQPVFIWHIISGVRRPSWAHSTINADLKKLIEEAWSGDPTVRPTFPVMLTRLRSLASA